MHTNPIAYVLEWDDPSGSTVNYDALTAHLGQREHAPAGLLWHAAGYAANGIFRIFEVWETAEDQSAFMRDRLEPALADNTDGTGGPPDRVDSYRLHSVFGGAKDTAPV